jgi:hypothetical protein
MWVVAFDMGEYVIGPFNTYEAADAWNDGNEDGFISELEAPQETK